MKEDDSSSTPVDRAPQSEAAKPLILCVGASAAAVDSIERFLSHLTLDVDQAIVLVIQPRGALDEGRLAGILRGFDDGVVQVRDGTVVQGGKIYFCAPDMICTLQEGTFAVGQAEQAPGERATIDSFLVPLAEERGEEVIGVLLAGTGGDGMLGVAALKEHGGLAIAERVYAPGLEGSADGNIPPAIADFVLAPEEIPGHINLYARRLRRVQIERLEAELGTTRERLKITIEELESTNEELKSSNEEYQSLNEELQTANDELETSREELQSVNEELTTVNGELAHRVQELTRATSDLRNFFESTQIATVFLDNDLRVMNFTPAVTRLLHLVETDVGRPIAHIKARVPIEELYDDVRRVLRTLASTEHELTAPVSGARYIVRILPYRSIDNFIAGVVMTFVDVTAIMRAEERQRLLLGELQHRVRNTLSVVRSIARRSAETSTTVEELAMHLDGRLSAFARTQALLTRDPEAGIDLEYVVVEEMLAYHAREGEQLKVSGPVIALQTKPAEMIGLSVHELATNAIKYGALSSPEGRVEVDWEVDRNSSPPLLVFHWTEKNGPPVQAPTRRGFGSELLEQTLVYELKARTTLAFEPSGLRCRISIPLGPRVLKHALPES